MSNFKKKIIVESLIYIFLPKISFIFSIISLPWISQYITLKDYGIYGIIISYITIFQTIISLGQQIIIQNSFFTHKKKYFLVWNRSFAIMLIIAVASSLFFYLSCTFALKKLLENNLSFTVFLVTFYFVFTPFDVISQNYFVLKQKPIYYSIGLSISGVLGSIVSIIAIRYYNFGYLGWLLSLSIIPFLNCIIFAKLIFFEEKIIPNFYFSRNFFNKSVINGVLLLPHQISLYILNASDRILLNFFKIPISKIGYYSQGYNLGSQGNLIVNGIFQSFTKNLQENFRSDEKNSINFIRKSLIVIPFFISIILFIISLWMKEGFYVLFKNPELNKSYPIAIIVISSFMYWSIYTFFTIPLSIKNIPFAISKISIIAAIINLIGNFLFIPKYGIKASIITTYVSYIFFGFLGVLNKENRYFFNKYINIIKLCLIIFFLNISLLIISFYLKSINVQIKFIITICAILFLVILFRTLKQKNGR